MADASVPPPSTRPFRPPRRSHAHRGRPLRFAAGVSAGVLVSAAAVALGLFSPGSRRPDPLPDIRGAARSYLFAIEPLAKEGGRVVQLGVKAGITDIGKQRYPEEVLLRMTSGWLSELESVRSRWASLDPPHGLGAANRLFLTAIDGYREAAGALDRAVRAPGGRRDLLVDTAAASGAAADRMWDRGASLVQAHLRDLGLDPAPWLADQASSSG